ncbi:MAG: hypothetical protein C0598_04860 [Marinilabiliales bacterium]|nr:MAG: hypothetical protein C0598_04860 [Marinilabiliales bacterium]
MIAFVNIGFALLLGLSLFASYIPATNFPIFAIAGLYYPVLLIINLAFILFWIFVKRKYILISLVIILLGFTNLNNTFKLSAASKVSNIDSSTFKVLSYNVRQFQASDKFTRLIVQNDILNFLSEQKAEIICLQEFQSHNKHIYEPLKQIRDTINSGSYYYESYYNPRYNYLTGIVTFSKLEAVGKGKLKFEGSRTFGIYTDFVLGDDTIRVFNMHLASISLQPNDIDFVIKPEAKDNEQFKSKVGHIYNKLTEAFILRQKQVELLKEEILKCPYDIILAGDFNDTPSSYVYNEISNLLNDSFSDKGSGMGITYAGKIPLLRIDYIFGSNNFTTVNFKKHNILRSDHYPVSAIFKTKN